MDGVSGCRQRSDGALEFASCDEQVVGVVGGQDEDASPSGRRGCSARRTRESGAADFRRGNALVRGICRRRRLVRSLLDAIPSAG